MILFHSCEYDSIEDAKKQRVLFKTASHLEGSYTNICDYLEIIDTFAKCMGIESGEFVAYWSDDEGISNLQEKVKDL